MADYELDDGVCGIKGCDKPTLVLGLCNAHWRRNKLYGSPLARRSHSGMFVGLTPEQRFDRQVIRRDGCWGWKGARDRDGYGRIRAEFDGVLYNRAHRFSYVRATGEHPGARMVLHRCDNPTCTNPDHLFLGTNAENMADKIAKGRARIPFGEDSGPAKLTEAQAQAILLDPRPYTEIASDYGVAASTVGTLKQRRSWAHLDTVAIHGNHRGRHRRGVSDKITPEIVRHIRTSDERGKDLAERYGVTQATITDIRKRRSWAHIE